MSKVSLTMKTSVEQLACLWVKDNCPDDGSRNSKDFAIIGNAQVQVVFNRTEYGRLDWKGSIEELVNAIAQEAWDVGYSRGYDEGYDGARNL